MKRIVLLLLCPMFALTADADEWPVFKQAMRTAGTPAPTNSGDGELIFDRIHPNEKIAIVENWTLEFITSIDFTLTGSITGYDGRFNNFSNCRSNSGRIVLKFDPRLSSPNDQIVVNSPQPGDIFIFQVYNVPMPIEDGSLMNIYCNYTSNAAFQNWHEGVDIYASSSNRNVYPIRDGIVVRVVQSAPYYDRYIVIQPVSPSGTPTPGVFDWYGHISIPEVSENERVFASGRDATKIATGLNFPDNNHLHFGVYDNSVLQYPIKSIKNPQNGLIPLPADNTAPECKEICFRSNDSTPVPTLFYGSIVSMRASAS